jgi:hypothetical protein
MEPWLDYGYIVPVVEVPLYWESTPRINNQVVSDSKRRIDRADHRFWNGTDKLAGPSLFHISSDNKVGLCSREELQWVEACNVPILYGRMTALVSQQGWHMIAVVNRFSAKG